MNTNIKNEIIKDLIKSNIKNSNDLVFFKRRIAKKYKISCPKNIELLKWYYSYLKEIKEKPSNDLEKLLKTRPVRSLSGIVNVSVLTKPYPCPGKCLYCPIEKGIPKSYISGEPAVERAKESNFNPYLQTQKRIKMLKDEGHQTDKIELRVIGGTWSYYDKDYQLFFIEECFRACNEMNLKKPKTKNNKKQKISIKNLKKEQKKNEKAKHRIIGLSIETRPDYINEKEIKWLRELGVTMVELGVQSIYDDVLKINRRGHSIKDTIKATKLLKDSGFKVLYQMMPNLLGSDLKKDEEMFKEIFENPDFKPDYLKIYPCAVLKEAPLYKIFKNGEYKPYSEKELINLLLDIKKEVPYYIRIQRIIRDISSEKIMEGGVKITNLRQILSEKMKKEGFKCKCIRCREVRENYNPKEKIYFFCDHYEASGGKEMFLSYENKDRTKLYSLLRLRIPSDPILKVLKNSAIIREIHTYGEITPIGKKKIAPQHKGLGKKLIKKAEEITKNEFNLNKLSVIAGVGVRDYFRKLGFKLKDTYMVKILK